MHMVLPAIALGIGGAAGIARYMRGSMLEVIHQDYIRTARAKGLSERTVIFKHALRNALIPIVTLLGLYLPYLLSGSVLVETIFAWPGMGRADRRGDLPARLPARDGHQLRRRGAGGARATCSPTSCTRWSTRASGRMSSDRSVGGRPGAEET